MALFARATSIFIISNRHSSKLNSSVRTSVTWINVPVQFTFCGYFILRRYSSSPKNKENDLDKFVTFDNLLRERRDQAKRSILVQVPLDDSIPYLHNYCSMFGNVKHMVYYSHKNNLRHCLVEFNSEDALSSTLKSVAHRNLMSEVPTQSGNLCFRRTRLGCKPSPNHTIPLHLSNPQIKNSQFFNHLKNAKTISEQVETCYSVAKLDDSELRLRFFMANEIERCFPGLLPDVQVLPFGSTVNGFGNMGSDLDMLVNLSSTKNMSEMSRLVFQSKPLELAGKYKQCINMIETIGEILKTFSPGIQNVVKIIYARVPIVKFNNAYTGAQCDLSIGNMSAIYMSELLYLYGEIDWRVRPVVFAVRKWAQIKKLTSENPGDYITNFSLTLLILFYFQTKRILPTLNDLIQAARKEDMRLTETNVNCTFLRDITNIKNANDTKEDCFDLLKGFFEYYSTFNYKSSGICLRQGRPILKSNGTALLINNPLEPSLNVSRNVSFKQIDMIRYCCRDAFWLLENVSKNPGKTNQWGIITLLRSNDQGKNDHKKSSSATNREKNLLNVAGIMNIKNPNEEDSKLQFIAN